MSDFTFFRITTLGSKLISRINIQSSEVPEDWFADWFDENYLKVYKHRNIDEAEQFVSNWNFLKDLPDNCECLDIGCGSGRYTFILAAAGLNVTGLDLSPVLLSIAVRETNSETNFVRANMHHLPFRKNFSLITSLFTSFGYFRRDSENRKVLSEMASVLYPDGIIIIDLPNPRQVREKVRTEPRTIKTVEDIEVREHRYYVSEHSRVNKEIAIISNGNEYNYWESVRLFSREEIIDITKSTGFELHELWGNYSGSPYSVDSQRMIYIGKRRD